MNKCTSHLRNCTVLNWKRIQLEIDKHWRCKVQGRELKRVGMGGSSLALPGFVVYDTENVILRSLWSEICFLRSFWLTNFQKAFLSFSFFFASAELLRVLLHFLSMSCFLWTFMFPYVLASQCLSVCFWLTSWGNLFQYCCQNLRYLYDNHIF